MIMTPSNTGAVVAGVGVGAFSWSAFLKVDKIPFLRLIIPTARKERTLNWMNHNKGMSLLALEAVNFGIHGITSSTAVIFAIGNTLFNVVMLFVYLPFRQTFVKNTQIHETLGGKLCQ